MSMIAKRVRAWRRYFKDCSGKSKPASAAKGQFKAMGKGLERPLRLEISPDGALYVVDFGVFYVSPMPKDKKTKAAFASTGVIWKVTPQGAATQH